MTTLTIIEDICAPEDAIVLVGPDVRELLASHFDRWPENGHLFHGEVAADHEIIITDEADWNRLKDAPGSFIMVLNPEGIEWIVIGAIVAGILLSVAAVFLLTPSVPSVSGNISSSNNDLSDRQNKARPLQRIPDILGEVRSTPDLLGVPVKLFEDRVEVEYAYLCIGRGAYDVTDIRDDATLCSELDGASVEVYGPNTSPLSGDDPQVFIGDPITQPLLSATASNAINGQVLYAPNYKSVDMAALSIGGRFQADGKINAPAMNWARYFEIDDQVTITGANYNDGSGHVVHLDGTYRVKAITTDNHLLEFDHPELVNSDWNIIASMADARTDFLFPLVEVTIPKTVGPFTLDVADLNQVIANLVASGGLYSIDSGGTQKRIDVTVRMTLLPLNMDGSPAGAAEIFDFTVQGAATTRSLLGKTCSATPTFTGRCSVSMLRTSLTDKTDGLQIVDEIKWRDLYAISPIDVEHFGNVTTVYSRSVATPAALGLKERKLNMNVVRKVPQRDGDEFSGLAASKSVADIFCFAALDPYIGGRALADLNVAQIYSAIAEVVDYFGTAEAAEFGATFDDDGTSFEEMAQAIAQAAFCDAQRSGSTLQLFFERETQDSAILFNHRNKDPGSPELRTVSFGPQSDYDGVEYSYVDSGNYDGPAVYRIPTDGSATRPKKIETVGQRNFSQAYWHAWREFNKIQYQHVGTEFVALAEAALVGRLQRVLVADGTKAKTQDGEVKSQSGLTLTLSQKVAFEDGKTYRIFLQIPNASVDAIPITPGPLPNQVILQSAPSAPLSLAYDAYARTTYWIVANDDGREQAFLISEKTDNGSNTYKISAVNYDARYYQNDSATPA
jgi:hypothetical protein